MNFIFDYGLHYILRMFIAGICGLIIGFERKNRAKGAGIRTHFMVATASALMMIISIMLFNAVDNVNVIERLIDRQTEQHQIGSNIRLEISPKMIDSINVISNINTIIPIVSVGPAKSGNI